MKKIYLITVTHDDGNNWQLLFHLGFFLSEKQAYRCANKWTMQANGELTRFSVQTICQSWDDVIEYDPKINSENLIENKLAELSQAEKLYLATLN